MWKINTINWERDGRHKSKAICVAVICTTIPKWTHLYKEVLLLLYGGLCTMNQERIEFMDWVFLFALNSPGFPEKLLLQVGAPLSKQWNAAQGELLEGRTAEIVPTHSSVSFSADRLRTCTSECVYREVIFANFSSGCSSPWNGTSYSAPQQPWCLGAVGWGVLEAEEGNGDRPALQTCL